MGNTSFSLFYRTITNVEEHIKNALISETSSDSVYKNIKIDADSIEIKRLLDHELLKSASFFQDSNVSLMKNLHKILQKI